MHLGAGAELSELFLLARSARIHLLALINNPTFPQSIPVPTFLIFLFYKVNEIVPPRVFVNRFRSFFHDFLIFAAFAALFWRFLRF